MTLFHSNLWKSLYKMTVLLWTMKNLFGNHLKLWFGLEWEQNKNKKTKKNHFHCIPAEKLSDVKNSIVLLIDKLSYTTARELGKASGKLVSIKFGLGDIVQLKTRNLYKVIENQWLWNSRMNLTSYEKAIKELIFRKSNIKFFNKKPLRVYDLSKTVIFFWR